MAPTVLASEAQRALFRKWAKDTVFALDVHDSPKRQFNVLAKLLNWVGGEEPWNAYWQECFGEVYTWRASPEFILAAATSLSEAIKDVVDPSNSNPTPAPSDDGGSVDGSSIESDNIWARFRGFTPDPTAGFNCEFNRLARHMRGKWFREERRDWRVKLFDADWEYYIGSDLGDLAAWQEFCRLCSIIPIPETIPGCMEVLSEVLVNIYDLLDSQRNGSAVKVFDTFEELREYTVPSRQYPINEAKEDTFLPIFLKDFRRDE